MTNLFEKVKQTNSQLEGWCSPEKAIALASMVVALRPETVVEIGVFGGRSLIPMALACRAVGHGNVIGIDPWDKAVAIREYAGQPQHQKWWAELDIESIRTGFLNKMTGAGLANVVTIIRDESRNVQPPNVISLLHVDGAHSETACKDTERFAPRVTAGGLVVMDDTDNSHGTGPANGVKWLLKYGFRKLYDLGSGAVFQRL